MVRKTMAAVLSAVLLLSAFAVQPGAADAASPEDIEAEARDHLGTPYRYGGTTPAGFDCSGFTGYVFGKNGIDLPRTAAAQYNVGQSVSKGNLQTGDLVFFTHGSGIQHNGIYIGNNQFIHASSSNGIMISSINDPYYWGDRYVGAKRVLSDQSEEKATASAVKSETLEKLPDGEYHDVNEDYWAHGSITKLGKEGIVSGYQNSTFEPSDSITREQAATILTKALDLERSGNDSGFNDVSSESTHAAAIKAVSEAGYINGNQQNEFMPDEPMTRQQMAVVFYRAFDLEGTSYDGSFVDVGNNHRYHKQIQALAGAGITTGNADGEFEPSRETTRAHFSVFLDSALEQ
ncbi:C40 family peptidase [Salibacterium qingdaonense]|uniref:Cell wall-associated hydrolase, NlpC family n=1 Tax=Salibacterium qingdaonense TaxID=266892 RepID=A0A1I4NXL4_9BACI|nr:C40 family peptidase [Salibacterium qingdaonense]SFM20262.1 Cell wall-associated hydrolase, NlpC family [Salibacterium qingdaonense]